MNDAKFQDLWGLMSQNTFESESISEIIELSCFMCKKLMIDACQTACGCQYCYLCISDYVADDSTYCPGGRQECNEEYLVLERDVMRNMRMNNKIYKLSVYCPNESCRSVVELSRMEEHLRLCCPLPCPCAALGCDKPSSHDTSPHTELLVGWVTNLKNEIDGLKERLNGCELEMESLRDVSKMKDIQIMEILEQREDHNMKMECAKKESLEKERRIMFLEEELEYVKKEIKTGSSEMIKQIDTFRKETENRFKKLEVMKGVKDKAEVDSREMYDNIIGGQLRRACSNTVPHQPRQNYDDSYMWTIDKISLRRKALYSDAFYCEQYKLCLSVQFWANMMSIWCYIMQGDNDDSLQWPMPHAVTLSIVNQRTLTAYKSETFCYESYKSSFRKAFHRPSVRKNEFSIGNSSFLCFSKLANEGSVVVNDSIVVSCVLEQSKPAF